MLPPSLEYLREALDLVDHFAVTDWDSAEAAIPKMEKEDLQVFTKAHGEIRRRLDSGRLARWMSIANDFTLDIGKRLRGVFYVFRVLCLNGVKPFASGDVIPQPPLFLPDRWSYLQVPCERWRWVMRRLSSFEDRAIRGFSKEELQELERIWSEIRSRGDEETLTEFVQEREEKSLFWERDAVLRLAMLFDRLGALKIQPFDTARVWSGLRPPTPPTVQEIEQALSEGLRFLAAPTVRYRNRYDEMDPRPQDSLTDEQREELLDVVARWRALRNTPEGKRLSHWLARPPEESRRAATWVGDFLAYLAMCGWLNESEPGEE